VRAEPSTAQRRAASPGVAARPKRTRVAGEDGSKLIGFPAVYSLKFFPGFSLCSI